MIKYYCIFFIAIFKNPLITYLRFQLLLILYLHYESSSKCQAEAKETNLISLINATSNIWRRKVSRNPRRKLKGYTSSMERQRERGGRGDGSHWESSGIIISKNRALFLIEYSDGVSHLEGLEEKRKVAGGIGGATTLERCPDSFFLERKTSYNPLFSLCLSLSLSLSLALRFDGHSSVGTLKITSCKKRARNGARAAARVLPWTIEFEFEDLAAIRGHDFLENSFKPAPAVQRDRKISLLQRRSLWLGYFSFLSLSLLSGVRKLWVKVCRFRWIDFIGSKVKFCAGKHSDC